MISAILLRREGVGQAAQTIWLDSRNGMPIRKRDLRRRSIELARAEADSSSGAADGSEPLKEKALHGSQIVERRFHPLLWWRVGHRVCRKR